MDAQKSLIQLAGPSYWNNSQRPLVSLMFVLPMLMIYEGGILLLGPDAMRNGAEMWLRRLLDFAGLGQYLMLPAVTIFLLLGWHYIRRDPWQASHRTLIGMATESGLFGLALLLFVPLLDSFTQGFAATSNAAEFQFNIFAQLVGFLGAGIYEELLFRLMMIPLLAWTFRQVGFKQKTSIISAIIISSLVFSAAHYRFLTPGGEYFDWYSFLFRFFAGLFFAAIFSYRGFGIAAGSHAAYDVILAFIHIVWDHGEIMSSVCVNTQIQL